MARTLAMVSSRVRPPHPAALGRRQSAARRCQRLEAQAGEQYGGACIPWIWNDKSARPLVEGAKKFSFCGLVHCEFRTGRAAASE